jgi:hypothetical protein
LANGSGSRFRWYISQPRFDQPPVSRPRTGANHGGRLMPARAMSYRDRVALCLVAVLHMAALIVMAATEVDLVAKAAFLLSWALLNCFWLALVRRPVVAALLALELVVALTLLSRFKFDKLWMTVDFVDLMIIDRDTSAFLLTVFPSLGGWVALASAATAALLIAAWRLDPHRVRVRSSLVGGALCMVALIALSLSFPTDLQEDFISQIMFRNSRAPASRQSMNSPPTDTWNQMQV